MEISPQFWKGKKVLLTGHTGFKGSWMALWLQYLGADVVGFSLEPPTEPNLFTVARVAEGMQSLIGDIRNLDQIQKLYQDVRPQIVFHMAAQALVLPSYKDPVTTYETNVMGTLNLLEAARVPSDLKVMVVITSDKCYENREWVWAYRENDAMGGYDPYSNSKGCAELVTVGYRNSFFHPKDYANHQVSISSARAGNVVGGGDWSEYRLIPDIVKAVLEKRKVVVRNPRAIRPWQHVLEPLSGYLTLAEQQWERGPELAEGWNFGPNEEDAQPVSQVVETLARCWDGELKWEIDQNQHPHEAQYLKLDCSKARARLNWRPRLRLTETLESIVQWTKSYARKEDMRALTLSEIESYQSREMPS